jgi:Arc/MetJ family transcription regulator
LPAGVFHGNCAPGRKKIALLSIHIIVQSIHIGEQMRTNIDIDDRLMRTAMRCTGARTKKAVVEAGLRLLAQTHAQGSIRRLRGKVKWEGDLEQSRQRRLES